MKKLSAIALISLMCLSLLYLNGGLLSDPSREVLAPMFPFYDFVEDSFTQINTTEINRSAHFNLFLENNLSVISLAQEILNLSIIEVLASKIFDLYGFESFNTSIIVCQFPLFTNIVGFYYWMFGSSIYVNFKVLIERNQYLALPTVLHELSHLLMFQLDPFEESWLQEGFAVFCEVMSGFGVDYYINPYMRAPETSLTNWSQKLEAYGMVFSFIYYLNMSYGFNTLKEIARSTDRSMESIKSVLGWNQAQLREFFKIFVLKIFLNHSEEIERENEFYLDSWSAKYIGKYRYSVIQPNAQIGNWLIAYEKPIDYKNLFYHEVLPLLSNLLVMSVVALSQLAVIYKTLLTIRNSKKKRVKGYS